MIQERIAALTTFVEEKYIPYFNYYWSYGMIMTRSVILAILTVITLIQIGITIHAHIKRRNHARHELLTILVTLGLIALGSLMIWGIAASVCTQTIAIFMLAAYLWMIVYQKKFGKTGEISCKPGKKCCLCPCKKCLWLLMMIGYVFVLTTGWLFFVE